jgi:hypothetical protein
VILSQPSGYRTSLHFEDERQIESGGVDPPSGPVASFTLAMVNVPGTLAQGLLAGAYPICGVSSMIAGIWMAAIFTDSALNREREA